MAVLLISHFLQQIRLLLVQLLKSSDLFNLLLLLELLGLLQLLIDHLLHEVLDRAILRQMLLEDLSLLLQLRVLEPLDLLIFVVEHSLARLSVELLLLFLELQVEVFLLSLHFGLQLLSNLGRLLA